MVVKPVAFSLSRRACQFPFLAMSRSGSQIYPLRESSPPPWFGGGEGGTPQIGRYSVKACLSKRAQLRFARALDLRECGDFCWLARNVESTPCRATFSDSQSRAQHVWLTAGCRHSCSGTANSDQARTPHNGQYSVESAPLKSCARRVAHTRNGGYNNTPSSAG